MKRAPLRGLTRAQRISTMSAELREVRAKHKRECAMHKEHYLGYLRHLAEMRLAIGMQTKRADAAEAFVLAFNHFMKTFARSEAAD